MATRLPYAIPRRPSLSCLSSLTPQTTHNASPSIQTQTRNATLIKRPRRPYSFTQLVQLSDGSTYTMRTASPYALYKPTKDSRNHVLWNPSEKSLKNVEVDEAGKLAAFRERFGRGWDAPAVAEAKSEELGSEEEEKANEAKAAAYDPLGDLISSYSKPEDAIKQKAYKKPEK